MPTVDQFKASGMTDLSTLTEEAISQLGDNFKILVLTKDTSINAFSVDVTAIPKRHLLKQQTDMTLPAPIKSFTLSGTVQNSSVLRVILSTDEGMTWQAFNGVDWQAVNADDLDAVASSGMTKEVLNAITEEQWKAFLSDLKIRFAYYLDLDAVTDTLLLDKLSYETVPVVNQTPKLNSIKITYDDLTIEGRLKDLERINMINMAKLNFKSNVLFESEKYEMHDMVIDTFETDSMEITDSPGSTTTNAIFTESKAFEDGYISELSLENYKTIRGINIL